MKIQSVSYWKDCSYVCSFSLWLPVCRTPGRLACSCLLLLQVFVCLFAVLVSLTICFAAGPFLSALFKRAVSLENSKQTIKQTVFRLRIRSDGTVCLIDFGQATHGPQLSWSRSCVAVLVFSCCTVDRWSRSGALSCILPCLFVCFCSFS